MDNNVNFQQVNILFNKINNSINELNRKQGDIKSQKVILRKDQQSAKIDYTLQYKGDGVHFINKQKANEVNMGIIQIVQKSLKLKLNDCLNDFQQGIK